MKCCVLVLDQIGVAPVVVCDGDVCLERLVGVRHLARRELATDFSAQPIARRLTIIASQRLPMSAGRDFARITARIRRDDGPTVAGCRNQELRYTAVIADPDRGGLFGVGVREVADEFRPLRTIGLLSRGSWQYGK